MEEGRSAAFYQPLRTPADKHARKESAEPHEASELSDGHNWQLQQKMLWTVYCNCPTNTTRPRQRRDIITDRKPVVEESEETTSSSPAPHLDTLHIPLALPLSGASSELIKTD